jgi:putative flippase GtrA
MVMGVHLIDTTLSLLPAPVRRIVDEHRELLRFAVVGGITFMITTAVNYSLKLTILQRNPVSALAVAVIIATIVSYVLNREWSFSTRGGRERHHEAALFFLISGVGVVLNSMPEYISHYMLDLRVPNVGRPTQEICDFVSGMIVGTLVAMAFRWWAFRKWVFPNADHRPARVRRLRSVDSGPDSQRVA